MRFVLRGALIASCIGLLAACDSSEERVEKHFQSGLELLEAGDVPRAMVEFRNVLALDRSHTEARTIYARAARENGNVSEAYSQFLQLAEQNADNMEARLALSEIAILSQNWDEAERHGTALIEAGSDLDGADIVKLALEFRRAAQADDRPRIRELTREAEALAESNPNDEILVRLLLDGYLTDNRIDDAIAVTRPIIDGGSDNQVFYQVMAELLFAKQDIDALEAHFRVMLEKFPDSDETKGALIRLLVSEGRLDRAEDFLRKEIEAADDKPGAHVNLIALIRQTRGDQAALEEIETAIATYESAPLLTALKAGLVFDSGQRDEAIALMESITEGQEASAEVDDFRVTLAKMLLETGNDVGARQLVEAVLDHDKSHVEALKMRATWQIEADQADEAIATLRLALDQAPDDAEAMTIMARAHERNGDKQLAQDLLALAVEASGNAPEESLRFARIQISEERFSTAEEVLINALRRSPGQPDLLVALGQVYLATEDWSRAEQVADTLRRTGSNVAAVAADELQLQVISRRDGRDQGVGFLEQLIETSSDATAAKVALIQTRIEDGANDDALALAQELVAEMPDDPRVAMVLGNTHLALADLEAAEKTFRDVIARDGQNGLAVMQLLRVLGAQDRMDEAEALVKSALERMPDMPDILWAKATIDERNGDIDGAIDIYERLYAMNSDNQVVANNLASLLVTYREDDADLERAVAVGKRLRGTSFPPFQDTYGWLQYRQGNIDEALEYLEPAAAAIEDDPIVQFHLAKAYLSAGRDADALSQFRKVVSLAGPSDTRDQIAEARAEIERLAATATE